MSEDFKSSSNRNGQVSVPINYNQPWEQVNSKATAWNDFISGLGMRMQHWAYMPYVIGATDTGSLRNYDEQKINKKNDKFIYDNNGMYKYMGDVYVIWQGNQKGLVQMPAGYYPNSSATITINRNYIDTTTIVGISEFDKFVPVIPTNEDPLEYASVNWEQLKHNPTGIDRCMFHVVHVDTLMDANGTEYIKGKDFTIEEGNVKWLSGGNRPGFDNLSGEGMVLSIRYHYIPSFYVQHAAHELRSHATIDPTTGEKKLLRGPMTAQIQIDWVFLQALKNQETNGDSATNAGTGGNTGPR